MKSLFGSLFFVFLLSSCSNADPKKMAEEVCGCVQTKKNLSSQAKKIVINAAKSEDEFQTALQTQLQKIEDEDKKQSVSDELNEFFLAIQSKKTLNCAQEVDKKYRVMKKDEKDIQQKMISEMSDVEGCEAYAAIVKLGLAKQNNTETSNEDEETDTPKKKRKVEEEE